jgi:lipopolysaccharide export system protein LptA
VNKAAWLGKTIRFKLKADPLTKAPVCCAKGFSRAVRVTGIMLAFGLQLLPAETITFTANKMSGYSGDASEYTKLDGNAYIKTSKIEVRADSIELTGDDYRFITAVGAVRGRNIEADMDFSCETMKYDRKTEVAMLQINADIFDRANNVTAKAQLIEYNQKTEVAVMQIDIQLQQKKSVCTAAFAIYRKKDQVLEMSGNPKVKQDADIFSAREITLNLDTEAIWLDGRVAGKVSDSGG